MATQSLLFDPPSQEPTPCTGEYSSYHTDALEWLGRAAPNSIQAVVTDPPYGLLEYSEKEQKKLRRGRGGVWRIPPSFDGCQRNPVPRFTVLKERDLEAME